MDDEQAMQTLTQETADTATSSVSQVHEAPGQAPVEEVAPLNTLCHRCEYANLQSRHVRSEETATCRAQGGLEHVVFMKRGSTRVLS